MSNSSKPLTDGIKKKTFGGLDPSAVSKILAEHESDRQTLRERLSSTVSELSKLKIELDSVKSNESAYVSQIEAMRAEAFEARKETADLRILVENAPTHDTGLADQLRAELDEAHRRLEETRYLSDELENLRRQLEIEREQHSQPGASTDTEALYQELAARNEEIERLRAQLTNVPTILAELDEVRGQLETSPSTAESEELLALRAEVERLHERQALVGDEPVDLDRTLVEARRILDDSRSEAERERDLIIEAAHKHAEEIVRRAQRQFSTESWEIEKIRIERRRYLSMFRALLNRHLHEVDQLEAEPLSSDLNEQPTKFATVNNGDSPFAALNQDPTQVREETNEFRSPFSYPQSDEPFRA